MQEKQAVSADLNMLPFRQRLRMLHPLQRAALVGMYLFFLLQLAYSLQPWARLPSGWAWIILKFSVGVLCILGVFLTLWIGRRLLRKRLALHDNLLCLRCKYHLTGLPGEGLCPECGLSYQVDETREMWRLFLRGWL